MICLNELSKVGYGGYRLALNSHENESSLRNALKYGCNVIDTASNYGNGESELLIGNVLKEKKSKNIFVISKAGYISGENLSNFNNLLKLGKTFNETLDLATNFKHSIHPTYLDLQLEISLMRLQRTYLDGFLLHNPEYYFHQKDVPISQDEMYKRISLAFEFLEEKVKQGKIRYYGVSSNTLITPNLPDSVNLIKLMEVANNVSTTHHFKLVQFPYNIIESQASEPKYHQNKSLIELAKDYRLHTFGNRPLNANSALGLLKLRIYENEYENKESENIVLSVFECINSKLKREGRNLNEFKIIAVLFENWKTLPTESSINSMFYHHLYPFLDILYNRCIPKGLTNLLDQFEKITKAFLYANQSKKTISYLKANGLESFLSEHRSLPNYLCEEYLKLGIDCVLVGMKKNKYVDDLKDIF